MLLAFSNQFKNALYGTLTGFPLKIKKNHHYTGKYGLESPFRIVYIFSVRKETQKFLNG